MREQVGLLLRYGLAGIVNTAVGFSAIVALDLGLGLPPALANAAGYALGLVVGFLLNRAFVFRSRGAIPTTGLRYLAAAAAAFVLNQAVLRAAGLALGAGRLQHLGAQALAMGCYTLALFLLCRLWVFRPAPPLSAR
jgi:putative flippase GtrA